MSTIEQPAFLRSVVYDGDAGATYRAFVIHLASYLRGGNEDNKFNFWVGCGGNGKSLCYNLLASVLGGYAGEVAKELYTERKKHAGGAEPHIKELRGRRLGGTKETDEGDVFLSGVFKVLSGEDSITCRGMFEKRQTTFTPQFKPLLMTNHLPKFSSVDNGIDRRIRVYSFPYTFCENPTKPEERKIDYELGKLTRSEAWRDQLLGLMVRVAFAGWSRDEVETGYMRRLTAAYRGSLNPLAEWFEENLEPKAGGKIRVRDAYFDYRATGGGLPENKFGEWLKQLVEVKRFTGGSFALGFAFKPKPAPEVYPRDDTVWADEVDSDLE